jgi:GNAT superfamily N-acetyltransferase
MDSDDVVWRANTHPLPWIKIVRFAQADELLDAVASSREGRQVQYFCTNPEVVLSCTTDQHVFHLNTIVARRTHAGHGTHLVSEIMEACRRRGLCMRFGGPYTPAGKGLALKLGLIRLGRFQNFYDPLLAPTVLPFLGVE